MRKGERKGGGREGGKREGGKEGRVIELRLWLSQGKTEAGLATPAQGWKERGRKSRGLIQAQGRECADPGSQKSSRAFGFQDQGSQSPGCECDTGCGYPNT